MLSAREFTVGSIAQASPLSLVLPRNSYEETILIAQGPSGPAAFFLSERAQFNWFESTGNEHWHGLIIPDIRIEIDERSIFDPHRVQPKLGTVVRRENQLIVQAKAKAFSSFPEPIVLENDLPPASTAGAGFFRWQVVLGAAQDKRVLYEVSVSSES